MSLNRNNPFVASLSTLVEPFAPESASSPQPIGSRVEARQPQPRTLLRRIEAWAGFGQTPGGAAEASSDVLLDDATMEARKRQLARYY